MMSNDEGLGEGHRGAQRGADLRAGRRNVLGRRRARCCKRVLRSDAADLILIRVVKCVAWSKGRPCARHLTPVSNRCIRKKVLVGCCNKQTLLSARRSPPIFYWRAKMPQSARYQTGDPSLLRQLNLAVVMHYLRERAPIYRAQLAEITGLNKTTVSSLVSELIAQQFVQETRSMRQRPGSTSGPGVPRSCWNSTRPPDAPSRPRWGWIFFRWQSPTSPSQVIWRQTERTRHLQGQQAIIDRLLALLRTGNRTGPGGNPPRSGHRGRGPGPRRARPWHRPLCAEPELAGCAARRASSGKRSTYPIFLDNEANLAALAEAQYGAARDYRDVLYISAGVGLGGGIVRDGQIYRGVSGFAGEFGHMRVEAGSEAGALGRERVCGCGNTGCWETYVSERALFADICRRIGEGQPSMLAWAVAKSAADPGHAPLTVPLVVDAAQAGDAVALRRARRLSGTRLAPASHLSSTHSTPNSSCLADR